MRVFINCVMQIAYILTCVVKKIELLNRYVFYLSQELILDKISKNNKNTQILHLKFGDFILVNTVSHSHDVTLWFYYKEIGRAVC